MRRGWISLSVLGLAVLAIFSACEKKAAEEQKEAEKVATEVKAQGHEMPPHEALPKQVVVPPEIAQRWQEVSILVKNKQTSQSTSHKVRVNSEFKVPDTNLIIKVGAFLPDFTMGGGEITSRSADPNNPGLQVSILDGAEEKYKGWLFAKYPEMHAFEHEKYAIILEDNFPAPTATPGKI